MAMAGPVSWAGPDPVPVWFDLAREFTERWHHQQQIRVGRRAGDERGTPRGQAWRLFTKGIDREKARALAVIGGKSDLAAPIFATTAIIG